MKQLKTNTLIVASALTTLFSESIMQDPSSYEAIPYIYQKLELSPSLWLNGRFDNQSRDIRDAVEYSSNNLALYFHTPVSYQISNSDSLRMRNVTINSSPFIFNASVNRSSRSDYQQDKSSHYRTENIFSADLSCMVNSAWYIKPDKFFTRLDFSVDGEGRTNGSIKRGHTASIDTNWTINSPLDGSTHYSYVSASEYNSLSQYARGNTKLAFGTGFGRAHDITYTAVAIHICNYLRKHNLLLNRSNSAVVQLSKVLEKLKRERTLDRREGKIAHITEISNWLVKEKMSKPLNSYHTMEIADFWDYAFNQRRYKGNPITAGLSGRIAFHYDYSEYKQTDRDFDTTHSSDTPLSKEILAQKLESQEDIVYISYDEEYSISRSLTPFVHYEHNKVTGLRSQLILSANASGGISIEKIQDTTESKSYIFDAELQANYYIYPSLRSDIELRAELNYQKYYTNNINFDYYNRDYWRSDLSSKFEYYLSPNTSLISQLSYMLNVSRYSDRDNNSDSNLFGAYKLSTGVVYKFF